MSRKLVTLLTIAGSDCTGGAGIQADIRAAAACEVYALSAVTAVTAQNSRCVADIAPVSPEDLRCQLNSISEEVIPDAVKIGMIGSTENGEIITDYLESLPEGTPIVVDPVLSSSAGGELSDNKHRLAELMISRIFPISTIVTPNLKEAGFFLNRKVDSINPDSTLQIATELLNLFNSQYVILKGGHLKGDILTDTLVSEQDPCNPTQYFAKRIDCRNLHGTGCTYASILASELAKGLSVEKAFLKASSTINKIISKSCGYSFGSSEYGPLNTLGYTTK